MYRFYDDKRESYEKNKNINKIKRKNLFETDFSRASEGIMGIKVKKISRGYKVEVKVKRPSWQKFLHY